ncbi:MAG: hypothetical protein WB784_12285 [Rhodanobacteraceae bacterium]
MTSYIAPQIHTGNGFEDGVSFALVGGTASVISGGKFANGAVTGAFQYAFGRVLYDSQHRDDDFAGIKGRSENMLSAMSSQLDEDEGFDAMNATIVGRATGAVFRYLGENEAPGYGFLDQVSGGISNQKFHVSYTQVWRAGAPDAWSGVFEGGGIFVSPLGARNGWQATFDIIHEVLHFNPTYANAWQTAAAKPGFDPMYNSIHAAMRSFDLPAATATYQNYYDEH